MIIARNTIDDGFPKSIEAVKSFRYYGEKIRLQAPVLVPAEEMQHDVSPLAPHYSTNEAAPLCEPEVCFVESNENGDPLHTPSLALFDSRGRTINTRKW